MRSCWSAKEGAWNHSTDERMSQYDVVYLSPPDDPMEGIPLGNGDIGGLLRVADGGLQLSVNKVDTWDDGPARHFENWGAAQEETHTILRSCGRLTIDLGLPLLETIFLRDFEARLGLGNATASIRADSALGRANVRAYASNPDQVMVVRVETETDEEIGHRATLSRIGSRSFGHWYSQVRREVGTHHEGTDSAVVGGRLVIRQKLRTLDFVVGMALVPDAGIETGASRRHSRASQIEVGPCTATGYTVYIAAATSESHEDPEGEVLCRLQEAESAGESAVAARHADEWRSFWSKSMVQLPDDYLANIWHLTLYFAGSSSRGTYPPHFCNGLWGWNHDFVPWYFYFHWNEQWATWQHHAADHAELAEPYLNYRFRQLPLAEDFARNVRDEPGAFYADVAERRGYQDLHVSDNRTPGPQIAMDFWRHYQFTGDIGFLRDKAFPVMRGVGEWYLTQVHQEADGRYRTTPGTCYESGTLVEDPVTDLAMLRGFLPALAEACRILGSGAFDADELDSIAENLVDYPVAALEPFEYVEENGRRVHAAGIGRGRPLASEEVPVAGFLVPTQDTLRVRLGGAAADYYGFPDPELAPVFPSGAVGLRDRGTPAYDRQVTMARLHPLGRDSVNDDPATMRDSGGVCMGWCVVPIACAWLGLRDETVAIMRDTVDLWQIYRQGLGHYGTYKTAMRDLREYHHANQVRDAGGNRDATFPFGSWHFRHFSNEAMPIVSTAINEMLLQSHEGVIRVCPATPEDWDLAFTLLARGGFKVSVQQAQGRPSWVWIESRDGRELVLENPWPDATVVFIWRIEPGVGISEAPATAVSVPAGQEIRCDTLAGRSYLVCPERDAARDWEATRAEYKRNEGPKRLGEAVLGKERLF